MRVAITREVSASLARCELTHLERVPINLERARAEHRAYEACLEELGCRVVRAEPAPDLPDAVFVEDVAVVVDEIAVLLRPGAASRRLEVDSIARALRPFRELRRTAAPACIDGGDILRIGRVLYVGESSRTDAAGCTALRDALEPFGYEIVPVAVDGCLHLKSGVTALSDRAVLLNPRWIDPDVFEGFKRVEVDPNEPYAANALRVGDVVVFPERFPRTRERVEAAGLAVRTVPSNELAKAEGALTCCSLLFEDLSKT